MRKGEQTSNDLPGMAVKSELRSVNIHVIDEFGRGIPVAWCLSSYEDFTTMVTFFKEVKKNVRNIQSDFFRSNRANQFYNVWVAVMNNSIGSYTERQKQRCGQLGFLKMFQ